MDVIEPILSLEKRLSQENARSFLFGETLCDLYFLNTAPLYYSIATSLTHQQLSHILDLDPQPHNAPFLLFYDNDRFKNLTTELLPDLQYPIYVHLYPNIHHPSHFTEDLSSIQRFLWDFKEFYNITAVEKDFAQEKLTLSQAYENRLTQDLLTLSQYVRHIAHYNLNNSTVIPAPHIPQAPFWHTECIKILLSPKPSIIFERLREWGVLERIFPELLEGYQVKQNEHHKYDVYYHSLYSCDAAPRESLHIRLSALLHDIGKPRAKKQITKTSIQKSVFYNHENIGARMSYRILKRFGFTQQACAYISQLVRLHMFHYTPDWTDNAVRRFIRNTDTYFQDLLKLREADRIGSGKRQGFSHAIEEFRHRISTLLEKDKEAKVTDLAINGHQLIQHFALQEGPRIGQLLRYLLQCTLDNPAHNDADILLVRAREWLQCNPFQS